MKEKQQKCVLIKVLGRKVIQKDVKIKLCLIMSNTAEVQRQGG